VSPQRQRLAGEHQNQKHEVHVEAGWRSSPDDWHGLKKKPSAQVFQQK
jgi:hypothetical protein